MPRAVLLGGLDEARDLPVGEIFTAALANCYIYCAWSRLAKPRVFHGNSPPACSYCYRFDKRCNRPGWMFKPSAARHCRGLRWAMRHLIKIAALPLLPLVVVGHARAAENEGKVITLSCEGTL